jgi:hypothetical protein
MEGAEQVAPVSYETPTVTDLGTLTEMTGANKGGVKNEGASVKT